MTFDVVAIKNGFQTTFRNASLNYINEEILAKRKMVITHISEAQCKTEDVLFDVLSNPNSVTNG